MTGMFKTVYLLVSVKRFREDVQIMNHQAATKDGRGLYQGLVPYEHSVTKVVSASSNIVADMLEANFYLAKEFYPELDKQEFQNYWYEEFQFLADQGIEGQLQLNFPEIPLQDLMEKYRELTRRLKGSGEDAEGIRNYYPDFFTSDLLLKVDLDATDWVTLIVENAGEGEDNDPTLFGLGLPCGDESKAGTICFESRRLIEEMKAKKPELDFSLGSARTRTIQSLLFMQARLARKEKRVSNAKSKIKFWAIQLLPSCRTMDGWVPYIFLDGGGGACLGRDGGGGNSVYGFCIQAKRNKT